MIWVLDASAAGELLLRSGRGKTIAQLLDGSDLFAPQLLIPEVVSLLRKLALGGHLSEQRAEGALRDFRDLKIEWTDMVPLIDTVWTHRHNISAYDAMYVALADLLDCSVLTCDERLVKASRRCVLPDGP